MIGRFSPFRALPEEGQPRLDGAVLADAFSQEAGELVLTFDNAAETENREEAGKRAAAVLLRRARP